MEAPEAVDEGAVQGTLSSEVQAAVACQLELPYSEPAVEPSTLAEACAKPPDVSASMSGSAASSHEDSAGGGKGGQQPQRQRSKAKAKAGSGKATAKREQKATAKANTESVAQVLRHKKLEPRPLLFKFQRTWKAQDVARCLRVYVGSTFGWLKGCFFFAHVRAPRACLERARRNHAMVNDLIAKLADNTLARSVVHRSVLVLGVSGTLFGRRLIYRARAGERACSNPAR